MADIVRKFREVLQNTIQDASNVFIVGHNNPDYDAIASALGLSVLCESLGKTPYIIVEDADIDLEPGVKKIIDDNKEKYNIIKINEFKKLKDKNSILITTDVNKENLISVTDYLSDFKDIVILDHHKEDDKTIKAGKKLIDPQISSASEIVARMLNAAKVKYDENIASYLLAGIILDTNRYIKNTSAPTHDIAEKLIRKGASTNYVNSLFLKEFDEEGKVSMLIYPEGHTLLQKYIYSYFNEYNVSFTINRTAPNTIYKKIDIAKAADKMLKFKVDASFIIGYIDENVVSISARSKSKIDVGEIMSNMGGGGNSQNAATRIEAKDIFDIEKELMNQVELSINKEEDYDNPKKMIKSIRKA